MIFGRAILLTVMMIFFASVLYAQEFPVPYEDEETGLWGFKDTSSAVVIDAQYNVVYDFLDGGIAAVADDEGWKYIDTEGNYVVTPFIYDNGPDYFSEGLARYVEEGKIGFIDESGNKVIPAQFEFAYPFVEGRARIVEGFTSEKMGEHAVLKGGKWGFIDPAGEVVIPLVYESALDYSDGNAVVKLKGEEIVIDQDGNILPD